MNKLRIMSWEPTAQGSPDRSRVCIEAIEFDKIEDLKDPDVRHVVSLLAAMDADEDGHRILAGLGSMAQLWPDSPAVYTVEHSYLLAKRFGRSRDFNCGTGVER